MDISKKFKGWTLCGGLAFFVSFEIWIFKNSNINQGINERTMQEVEVLESAVLRTFERNVTRETKEEQLLCIQYYVMHVKKFCWQIFFLHITNLLFRHKICVNKHLLSPSKKISHTICIYGISMSNFYAKIVFLRRFIELYSKRSKTFFWFSITQFKKKSSDYHFFIDLFYGIAWLIFSVYESQSSIWELWDTTCLSPPRYKMKNLFVHIWWLFVQIGGK